MKNHSFLSALALLALAALPHTAQAQTTAFTIPANPIFTLTNPTTTVGYTFTVGASAISVTDLGFYDHSLDGLVRSHVVSIWNSAGTQLGTDTVPGGTVGILSGAYRYVTLGAPISLDANTTYTIGATVEMFTDHTPWQVSAGSVTPGSGISSLGAPRGIDGANTFSTSDQYGVGHYMTPNFKFSLASVAPEPGTLAFLALGGGLVIMKRRRK